MTKEQALELKVKDRVIICECADRQSEARIVSVCEVDHTKNTFSISSNYYNDNSMEMETEILTFDINNVDQLRRFDLWKQYIPLSDLSYKDIAIKCVEKYIGCPDKNSILGLDQLKDYLSIFGMTISYSAIFNKFDIYDVNDELVVKINIKPRTISFE